MAAWLLSIVGVITIGVLLDILMPDGEINKYIKGIFSIVVVLVIVAPIPKLIKSDFNIDEIMGGGAQYEIDEDFVGGINMDRKEVVEAVLADKLNSSGIITSSVTLTIEPKTNKYLAIKVVLNKGKIGDAKIVAASTKAREIILSDKRLSECEVSIYAE